MAHREGGQTFGNQEEIKPLGKDDFYRYMSDGVTPSEFGKYIEKYPDTFISLVRQNNQGGWRLNRVGSLGELLPRGEAIERGWARKVDDFSTVEAIRQGRSY